MSASTSASTNPSLPGRSTPGGSPSGPSTDGAVDAQRALAEYLSGLLGRLCALSKAQAGMAFIQPGEQRAGGLAAMHAPDDPRLIEQVRGDAQL